nr:RNA methyltransferase [Thalassobacillus pellis]
MITSIQNQKVKQWNKLKKKKYREAAKHFIVEGFHLVEEAFQSEWEIVELIVREDTSFPVDWKGFTNKITHVSNDVFSAITETETPQGIAAIIEVKHFEFSSLENILLTDGVQDPGNLGTLIRTADAAGFDGVIIGKGSVDVFNEKVIRATQGSLFHLPIQQGTLEEWIPHLKKQGLTIWASALKDASPYKKLTVPEKSALIVGNEGAGIREELLKLADKSVYIPIYGKAESLNVAIAAGILMYHMKK